MLWPETTSRTEAGLLTIGGIPLVDLAERFGTPLYVFDEATLRNRARAVAGAMARHYPRSKVLYAGKAFLSPAIVQLLHGEGLGLDVVSSGELHGGLLAGVPAAEITFHGNNKSPAELREAVAAGVGQIAIDNALELERLSRLAADLGTRVRVLLRLNPGIDVHTHAKIKTGAIDSKFGFPLWTGDADRAADAVAGSTHLDLVGYHVHLGSQLFEPEAGALATSTLFEFAAAVRDRLGIVPETISPGGGFGIAYTDAGAETAFESWAAETGAAALRCCARYGFAPPELTVEPGRFIVGPAAVALYTVGARRAIPGVRTYVSVDGGMADNIRPSLYGARYTAEIASRAHAGEPETVTIAGRYCESGDILIDGIALPRLEPGDLLAMPAAGAYALPMASNYNATPRPAVVMVGDGDARIVRRRETYADVFAADEWEGRQVSATRN